MTSLAAASHEEGVLVTGWGGIGSLSSGNLAEMGLPALGKLACNSTASRYTIRLPYAYDALTPYISAHAIRRHCGEHAAFYAGEVEAAVRGTAYEGRDIEDILRAGCLKKDACLLHHACHIHNHQLYWNSMSPAGGGQAEGALLQAIVASFGSWEEFLSVFRSRAENRLWAGWLWLVRSDRGVSIMCSTSSSSPLLQGYTPLLALDLWEYAYHFDYGTNRMGYIDTFLEHLVDWRAAARRFR